MGSMIGDDPPSRNRRRRSLAKRWKEKVVRRVESDRREGREEL